MYNGVIWYYNGVIWYWVCTISFWYSEPYPSIRAIDEGLMLEPQLLISLLCPIYVINSVYNTKLPCYTLPQMQKIYPLSLFLCIMVVIYGYVLQSSAQVTIEENDNPGGTFEFNNTAPLSLKVGSCSTLLSLHVNYCINMWGFVPEENRSVISCDYSQFLCCGSS